MARGQRGYEIVADEEALQQLRWLRRHDRAAAARVEGAIAERLTFQPTGEDRNKKATREGAAADWELRVQPYRVYYAVDEAMRRVTLISIHVKPRETGTPLPTE